MSVSCATTPPTYAVLYTRDDGHVSVHYRRPRLDTELARQVLFLQRKARAGGYTSPYSLSTKPEHIL